MAIKISQNKAVDNFFTIENSSILFNKGSKGVNSNPSLGDVNRAHIQGFAEKHVQAALENIAKDNSSLVSGDQQDGFALNEELYAMFNFFRSKLVGRYCIA